MRPLWQKLNELSYHFSYDSPEARTLGEAAEKLKEQAGADEPTFVLNVKLSLVVDGWANAGSPLTRDSIAGLVKSRLDCGDIESLIDSVEILEVRDSRERLVVDPVVLGGPR